MAGQETTYRFDGDGSALLAELRAIRAALTGTAVDATKTGAAIDKAAAGSLLSPIGKSAAAAKAELSGLSGTAKRVAADLSKATTSLGATNFVNLNTATTSLGATAFQAEALAPKLAAIGPAAQKGAAGAHLLTTRMIPLEKQTRNQAFQTQQLGYQLNDFFVQVSSGQGLLMPLIQQGSQLAGTFGGIRGALAALATVFTPVVLGIAAVAAVVGTIGYIFLNGQKEATAFKNALTLTGNFAGMTADKFRDLTQSVADYSKVSRGAARETLLAIVSTGQFQGAAINEVAKATLTLAKLTGKSTEDIVADFAKMGNGVAKWAADHNRSYHYLTIEQFRYIKQLEAQGRAQDAITLNTKLLNKALGDAKTNLGYLETAWLSVKNGAKKAWDAMLGISRDETIADKIANVTQLLGAAREALAKSEARGDKPTADRRRNLVANLQTELEGLRLSQRAEDNAAREKAEAAAKNAKEIEREQNGYQGALLNVQMAGYRRQLAAADLQRAKDRIGIENGYAQNTIGLKSYIAARYGIERRGLNDRLALINEEAAQERATRPGTENERLAKSARLVDIDTKRFAILTDIARLEDDRRNFRIMPEQLREEPESNAQRFAQFERAHTQATLDGIEQRRDAALSSAHDLVGINRDLTASLILDDRQRGLAQLAIDEKNMRERLDMGALNADERRAVEERFNQWRVLKERELTERLKPEWQRRLTDWKDTNRLMKQSFDDFMTGWQDTGKDAWAEFIQTGKLNIKSFTSFTLEALSDLSFKKIIAPAFTDAGAKIAGFLGLGNGADTGAATAATAQAAQTAAVGQSVLAFQSLNAALAEFGFGLRGAMTSVGVGSGSGGGIGGLLGGLFGGRDFGSMFGGGSSTGGVGFGTGVGFGSLDMGGFLAGGGKAKRGTMYEVNERGPELLTSGGRDFLMMGAQDGNVTSNRALSERARSASMVASGGGGSGSPNVRVIVNTPPGVAVDRQQSKSTGGGTDVELFLKMAEQRVGENIARGRGPVAAGLKHRGVNLGGSMPRVG